MLKRFNLSWDSALCVVLVLSLLTAKQISSDFWGTDNLSNLLASVVEIALMGLGLALLVVAAEIDISIAAILGLASGLLGLLHKHGVPMPVAIGLALFAGAAAGGLNGWLVTRLKLPSLAVTIGTMALFRGITYILLGDEAVADFPDEYTAFALGNFGHTFLPLTYVWLLIPLAVVFIIDCLFAQTNQQPLQRHHRWPTVPHARCPKSPMCFNAPTYRFTKSPACCMVTRMFGKRSMAG